jgi:phosphatidylglycerol---prolipoprotein diacylglyceryl transferase
MSRLALGSSFRVPTAQDEPLRYLGRQARARTCALAAEERPRLGVALEHPSWYIPKIASSAREGGKRAMHPELEIFGFTVRSYALLSAVAMLAAFVPVRSEARRFGWDVESMSWLVLTSTLVGWLGAHVLYVVTRIEADTTFYEWLRQLLDFGSGSVWYGGFLASWLLVDRYARRRRIPPLRMWDVAIFAVLVAQAVGRLGCLLAGCCYGTPTELPWAVTLTNRDHFQSPVHPTPLYEALFLSVLFVWLWRTRKARVRPGHTAALYLAFSAAGRFVLEFSRGDTVRGFVWGWLSTSQFIAVLLAVVGTALYAHVVSQAPARADAD